MEDDVNYPQGDRGRVRTDKVLAHQETTGPPDSHIMSVDTAQEFQ